MDKYDETIQDLRWKTARASFSYFADAVRSAIELMLAEEGFDPDLIHYRRDMDWTTLMIGEIKILKFRELVVFDEQDSWTVKWVVSKDLS